MVQHKQQHKSNHNWGLDYVIILEYSSTIKVTFINPDLVTNTKPINNPFHMSDNAGTNKWLCKLTLIKLRIYGRNRLR